MVRCKFRCVSKTFNSNGYHVKMEPVVYGSPENEEFFRYTPFGVLEIGTINDEAAKEFTPGKEYLLDISLASPEVD